MPPKQSKIFIFDPITQEKKDTTYEYLSELTGRTINVLRSYKAKKFKLAREGWYIIDIYTTKEEFRKMINFEIKNEVWKDYIGSSFEVSNFGRVRNKNTKIIRKLTYNNGSIKVMIKSSKGKRLHPVHGMILDAFKIKKIDGEKNYITHLDGNVYNCRIENLKYVSKKEFFSRNIVSNKGRIVFQIDIKSGKIIDEFFDCVEAAKEKFCDKSCIARAVRKKRASFGFAWATKETLEEVRQKIKDGKINNTNRYPMYKIKMIDKETKEVKREWQSIKDTSIFYGVTKNAIYYWIDSKRVFEENYILIKERYSDEDRKIIRNAN